ncbi:MULTISPECIES: N-6 DNA methylase [unclassified Flavobacterium]|jgi:type I restriction enzyme M protein|uniref:N-6 DNA methylase n=1 Tax=unclassified Flavobacterium TaxID=196869 RepID=UPI0025C6FA90|nr:MULTISPECIES: N-6 DNA methylase [unclassified Flavobacterium]
MFQQTFKNIDDILHKDAGCGSELDYVEQTSWVLFLKYLDDLEKDKATAAELTGKEYTPIIAPEYQWNTWASPKDKDGKLNHHTALTGDDLEDFVNIQLFPYFKKYKQSAESADTIEYKIGEIFSELKNRIQSGYNLREIINRIDELRFRTHAEKHEMSHLYEDKIKNMGNAGRNGGEYYTPRPLIKTIIKVVAPEIGQTIYDGAVGSAGFLCEAFDYLMKSRKLTTSDITTLQKKTFYGKEKKSLAYIIGTMNMILHGVEAPNIVHTNTLAENIADIQEKDRYDIILANPPFGGKERAEVQQNFPIKTGETASLFLQHFIKILKAGGKAGIVIKNTFLSNADNSTIAIRRMLLENCNLHTILDLPVGTFIGVGQKTVVLFFEKGKPTSNIWHYELKVERSLGKREPINENDFVEFIEFQKEFKISNNSWFRNISEVDKSNYDLTLNNPNKKLDVHIRQSNVILPEFDMLTADTADILKSQLFHKQIEELSSFDFSTWEKSTVGKVCEFYNGKAHEKVIDENGDYIVVNSKFISTDGDVKKYTVEQIFPLYEGDVVLVMSDLPNGKALGKCFLIDESDKYSLNQRICSIRSERFNSKFLYYQLNRNKHFLDFNNGENQTNLRKGDILDCPVLIPPVAVQDRIVEILDNLKDDTNQIKVNVKETSVLVDELQQSILGLPFKF